MPEEKLSFIPKKTFTRPSYKAGGPGLLVIFAFLVFLISLVVAGGLFFYKSNLEKQVDLLIQSLERAKAAFEPSLISEMIQASVKIDSAKSLFAQHKTLIPILDLLSKNTLKNVRFNGFNYSGNEKEPIVTLKGVAKDYTNLAVQAKVFEDEKNIKSVSFSDFSLGDKGIVNFSVKIVVAPSFLAYKPK